MSTIEVTAQEKDSIVCEGEEVRQILAGQKTQKRIVIEPQPATDGCMMRWKDIELSSSAFEHYAGPRMAAKHCPYQPGDKIWVLETWRGWEDHETMEDFVRYQTDDALISLRELGCVTQETCNLIVGTFQDWQEAGEMPPIYSRLLVEICSVRAERLQAITEEDARAEGIRLMREGGGTYVGRQGPGRLVTPWLTAKDAYLDVWDSLHGEQAGHSSKDNLWVWVWEFRCIHREGGVQPQRPEGFVSGPLVEDHARYFNIDRNTHAVTLDKITPIRARPEGIANAEYFMHCAYHGTMEKRDPISLEDQGEGTYKVMDGNSTFAIAQKHGWTSIAAKIYEKGQWIDPHVFLENNNEEARSSK